MKIKLDKEYEVKLTSPAVDKLEEKLECSMSDLFVENKSPKAKTIMLVVWAAIKGAPSFEETTELFEQYSTHVELLNIFNQLIATDPNAKGADVTEKI